MMWGLTGYTDIEPTLGQYKVINEIVKKKFQYILVDIFPTLQKNYMKVA